MRAPSSTRTEAPAANVIAPTPQKGARSTTKGDVPPTLLDRYLIERDRLGRPERFYRDHRAANPMFRDEGKRLVAAQSYPDIMVDMVKIAQHRGWTQVRVSGDETFRREAWIQARTIGLEVRGYQPRERDRQAAGEVFRRPDVDRSNPSATTTRAEQRLRQAAVVVRRLIAAPAAQARLLEQAYRRAREANVTPRREPTVVHQGSENDRARR